MQEALKKRDMVTVEAILNEIDNKVPKEQIPAGDKDQLEKIRKIVTARNLQAQEERRENKTIPRSDQGKTENKNNAEGILPLLNLELLTDKEFLL